MFHQLLCLVLAYDIFGQAAASDYDFKENSDYFITKLVDCDYMYITVDGVNISRAANGLHCIPPNDCWEIVKSKRVLVAEGRMRREHAAFVVQPMDSDKRSPIAFQYRTYGAPDSSAPNVETRSVLVNEIQKNEYFIHVVLFNADIGNITAVGDFDSSGITQYKASTVERGGMLRENTIIITGHLATRPRRMEVKCRNIDTWSFSITPSNEASLPMTVLTFIDYANAFKLQ